MQQGILTERAEGIYSFSHLTVQEYLTAKHVSQSQVTLTETIKQRLTERSWREVLLLVPGLLPNADDLLRQMKTMAEERIGLPKFQSLLNWAHKATINSINPADPLAKRALAIFFALERYRDRHRDRDLTNALNLNRDINLTRSRRFPDPFLERSHSLDLIYALDQALDRARSLVLLLKLISTLSKLKYSIETLTSAF